MRVGVKFEGGAELSRALRELGEESTKTGRTSLRATANELRAVLRETAPVGTGPTTKKRRLKNGQSVTYDYGRLRDNIRVREQRAIRDNSVVMAVSTGNAFWAVFREFGTVDQPARPWFRPVWDSMQTRLIDYLGKRLWDNIDRTARRQARRAAKAERAGS